MCDFHIFIDIFEDISPFHHFNHFFVKFFSCGVWGGCGGVAGLHRKVFIISLIDDLWKNIFRRLLLNAALII